MKKIKAIIECCKDGYFCGVFDCDDLEYGVSTNAASIEEVKRNLEGIYLAIREDYAKEGRKFTEVEWEYEVDYASILSYYAQFVSLVGLSHFTGINKGQLSHYLNGTSRPRPATIERMRKGFAKMAEEIRALSTI